MFIFQKFGVNFFSLAIIKTPKTQTDFATFSAGW